MNSSFVRPKSQTQPRVDKASKQEEVDDAASSSATHGSVSRYAESSIDLTGTRNETPPSASDFVAGFLQYDKQPKQQDACQKPKFDGMPPPETPSSGRPFCLDRFVKDVDPREKARMGKIESRPRSADGCGGGGGGGKSATESGGGAVVKRSGGRA